MPIFALKNAYKMIGRLKESEEILRAYEADSSKFVAILGRRRVGKTFLVRETFHNTFAFSYTGLANVPNKDQLQRFHMSLMTYGYRSRTEPGNWLEAFYMLEDYLSKLPDGKKVVFLDELPWMDAPRSLFMAAFEHFWNGWASARKDILLIVCGSATSWMVKKILRNKGGLYNRVTNRIHLQPFNLKECEAYADSLGMSVYRPEILEAYMIFGGIPFYWSLLDRSKSLSQNIDRLFFGRNPTLGNEFNELYASLFKQPDTYESIISALGTKKVGMTRDEIIKHTGVASSGFLSKYLEDLENCGFIRKYYALGAKTKNAVYQLIDNFTLFYFKFVQGRKHTDENYWSKIHMSPVYHNWCGLAFERVCLLHTPQIKRALGISGILTEEYSWRASGSDEYPGAQIDLLIDRSDKAINLCEMKYTEGAYAIDRRYMENLRNKAALFRQLTNTRKGIAITMITSTGLVTNAYSMNGIHAQVIADDLFSDV